MGPTTADVIIIGAGVHGASLACALARRGASVQVLERHHVASGATGRSSGLVRMHYDLELEARLAWASHAVFRDWQAAIGGECGFTRTGFLFLARPSHNEALRANVAMHRRLGIPTQVVAASEVRRIAPLLAAEDFELAAYEPESGYADPTQTAGSFLRAARDHGARLVQDCPVTSIVIEAERVGGVVTPLGRFSAPVVVNAAGAWAGPVARLVGLDLAVDTWRHDVAFLRRPAALAGDHPAVIDDVNSMYFRPETGGLTLVGLEDGNPIGLSPEDEERAAPEGFVDRAVDRLCRRIPGMQDGSLHSTHGGFDGITPDQRPLIGPAGPEGFYLDCGFSGTGFKISPAVGESLAHRILDGRYDPVDLSAFDPQRFARGELLRGEHAYEMIWR